MRKWEGVHLSQKRKYRRNIRKLRRELHEAADVGNFLSDMLLRFRNRLLAVSPMRTMGESNLSKLTDIVQKEMLATLDELAEYDPDEIDKIAI